MTLKKTKLLDVTSVTGVTTVGIFTAGINATPVGTSSTSYVKSVVMHNTGLGTARVSLYVYPNTGASDRVATNAGLATNRILRVDVSPNETTFFETNYPIVLSPYNAIAAEIQAAEGGGPGIGSMVNFIINGDTDI